MALGSGWQITAWMKLVDTNTRRGVSCDHRSNAPGESCPKVEIAIRDRDWDQLTVSTSGFNSWDPNNYNEFRGFFWFPVEGNDPKWIGDVRDSLLVVTDYPLGTDLFVDNFVIRRLDN